MRKTHAPFERKIAQNLAKNALTHIKPALLRAVIAPFDDLAVPTLAVFNARFAFSKAQNLSDSSYHAPHALSTDGIAVADFEKVFCDFFGLFLARI